MLYCKIKLIKTAKLLFSYRWATYCHMGKEKKNISDLQKTKQKTNKQIKNINYSLL